MKDKRFFYWLLGILVITFIAYIPALSNALTNWDDDWYIIENTFIQKLSFESIQHIFSNYYHGQYSPLTTLLLAIDYRLVELAPWLYHFMSVLFHLVNVALVFWLVYLLVKNLEITVITALLFGVHTLQVESVAWVSAQKIVLFALFFLASLIYYVRYVQENKVKFYWYSLILFVLSFLSKEQAVSLSITLFAIDFLLGRKIFSQKVLMEKIPFLFLSCVFGIISLYASKSGEGIFIFHKHAFYERILYAGYALGQYILKLFIPFNLSSYYPYPDGSVPLTYWFYLVGIIAIIILLFYTLKDRKQRNFIVLFFAANIIFTLILQVMAVRDIILADRYVYIPSIAFFFLIGIGYKTVLQKKSHLKSIVQTVFAVYIMVMIILTYNRTAIWKDSITLWTDVISKYPDVSGAWNNRGMAKNDLRDYNAAIADFNQAIKINPDNNMAYSNRGIAKRRLGDIQGAIADYSKAIKLQPDAKTYTARGITKSILGDFRGAIVDFDVAINMNPTHRIYSARGIAKGSLGDFKGAVDDFNEAIRLKPDFAQAYFRRGLAKIELGRKDEACNDLNKSYELGFKDAFSVIQQNCTY